MPANLMTLAHFSVSAAMSLPKSAGELGCGSLPNAAYRDFKLASARAELISVLSLSTILAGVPFGAPIPPGCWPHSPARNRPRSELGQRLGALRCRHCQRSQLAGPDVCHGRRHEVEHDLHLTADQVGERRRRAAVRHVKHVDTGHHLEQLASEVR